MFHWLVVGHFDPLDRVDTSEKPHKPKPQRPIPLADVEQALGEFGRDIEPYLSYCEGGYVICNWSIAPLGDWGRVGEFASFLAKRADAMVMDERYMLEWPRAMVEAARNLAKHAIEIADPLSESLAELEARTTAVSLEAMFRVRPLRRFTGC